MFRCDADLSGEELPMTWANTVKKLKDNYATDAVSQSTSRRFSIHNCHCDSSWGM